MNRSFCYRSFFLATFLLLTGTLLLEPCGAWSLVSQPVEGVLVLRNGNILRGKVQKQGDRYHLYLPNGQLQVRENQVEMVCENLEEAYQRRRETRGGSSADSHLQLAGWCLRHDLYSFAEAELKEAEAIDPTHPRLVFQRRQLKHALQMSQMKLERKRAAKLAGKSEPLELKPFPPASVEKAPLWARTLFVRQIQPLVVHSCATSGCHQADSDSVFRINRLAVEGAGHPGATMRNLAALLEQIDWNSAEHSNLLCRAKEAHGLLSASKPLPLHKIQVLQSWVEQLTEAQVKKEELSKLALLAKVPTKVVAQPVQKTRNEVRQASYESADPLDPSTFNRRHSKKKQASQPSDAHSSAGRSELPVPHASAPGELTSAPSMAE